MSTKTKVLVFWETVNILMLVELSIPYTTKNTYTHMYIHTYIYIYTYVFKKNRKINIVQYTLIRGNSWESFYVLSQQIWVYECPTHLCGPFRPPPTVQAWQRPPRGLSTRPDRRMMAAIFSRGGGMGGTIEIPEKMVLYGYMFNNSLVVWTPLKNISQLGWLFPILMGK